MVRKIKKKTGASVSLSDIGPGMRMKGGVCFDPDIDGFVAIVHIWDNVYCQGDPQEWRTPKVFATEEAALLYYKTNIYPILDRQAKRFAKTHPDVTYAHRKLEE